LIDIRFSNKVSAALSGATAVAVLAPKGALDNGVHRIALGTDWAASLDAPAEDLKPGLLGAVGGTYGPGKPRRLFVGALPDKVSRHNSPTRAEMIRHCAAQVAGAAGATKKLAVIICIDDPSHAMAAGMAVARCYPLFNQTSGKERKGVVQVACVLPDGSEVKIEKSVKIAVDASRFVARLVDTPPQDMKTSDMEKEARAAVKGLAGVKVTAIVGDRLLTKKMGGIHAVGRTATVAPRMVVLEYKPKRKARRTVVLVGKGVVYDTGGLSLKVGGSMPNMKCDMGGASAVLGAFLTLAQTGSKDHLYCVLCLAENAIGPDAYRPDDILTMHSGKTVEINNTDAEGRLVLADGVSYAARDLGADLIIDAATLTGAALLTSGPIISCCATNRDGLESRAVVSGKLTGDVTHPLLFAPEFFKSEFTSKVADMRNSVKTRMNAQSSCAGQFIYNHIEELDTPWMHLDIAGPAFRDGRGTGYGTALISEIVNNVTDDELRS